MPSKIRYTEIFYSIQGEGMFAGVPSLFFRTFGCNFRCKKFGIDRDVVIEGNNPDVQAVIDNIDQYQKFDDLPIIETGCDTYTSIYPEFKRFAKTETVEQIVDKFIQTLPDGKFGPDVHLIFTGGEPMLGWQNCYIDIINEIRNRNLELTDITFETNGTQPLTTKLLNFLNMISTEIKTTWSISAKLPVSGHDWNETIKPTVVKQYSTIDRCNTYLKFVVASEQDVIDAHTAIDMYKQHEIDVPVYLMAVGGTNDSYQMNEKNVAEHCIKHKLRFSPRLQVGLFKNAWAT